MDLFEKVFNFEKKHNAVLFDSEKVQVGILEKGRVQLQRAKNTAMSRQILEKRLEKINKEK